jgi:hypothetical protein
MSGGQRVVTAFYLLFYVVPLIGFTLLPHRLETPYRTAPPSWYALLLLAGTYSLFLALSVFAAGSAARVRWRRLTRVAAWFGRVYRRRRLAMAVALLALVPVYLSAGYSGYRYDPQNLSEINSSLLLFVVAVHHLILLDVFYSLFVQPQPRRSLPVRYRLESVLLASLLVFFANGTASMVLALGALAYSLFPRLVVGQLFTPRRAGALAATARLGAAGTVCLAGFFVAWLLGETIKNTVTQQQDASTAIANTLDSTVRTPGWAQDYGLYLVSAVSSYYHALVYTSEVPRSALTPDGVSPITYPLRALLFRFDYLAGDVLGIERPVIVSLSRLNYLNTIDLPDVAEREGSSPGVIASFTYVFPFPFNLLLCAVYLVAVSHVIDVLLAAHPRETLSPIGVVAMLVFVMGLLQSPFDLLAIFDPIALFFAGVAGIYLVQRQALAAERRARRRALAREVAHVALEPSPLPAGR